MNIRILGAHSRESHDSRFVCLLIDDVLTMDAGVWHLGTGSKKKEQSVTGKQLLRNARVARWAGMGKR